MKKFDFLDIWDKEAMFQKTVRRRLVSAALTNADLADSVLGVLELETASHNPEVVGSNPAPATR